MADLVSLIASRARMLVETRAYRLREMREEQGLTQVELAARMYVTQPSVSALERGDLEKPAWRPSRLTTKRSAARSRWSRTSAIAGS